jgi:DNA helicase II / ATP-dependent DNA helicase PcrA
MNNILNELNSPQQSAVTKLNGILLVLAGAGSGKTKVLTHRIAYLINNGISPYEILAVTFTNKAAKEMKLRLVSLLGEDSAKKLWVGTFHSICGRILRQDIENHSSSNEKDRLKNYVIYDQNDSLSLIKQAIKILGIDDKTLKPKVVQSVISMAKNKMHGALDFAKDVSDFRNEQIAKVFKIYEDLLGANNALDFDDMLLMTVNLLSKSPEVLLKYQSRFKHILVDEFQDTNLTQYKLISSLYGKGDEDNLQKGSLCVVGDIDQSIYSWRGADFRILLNFKKDYPSTEIIKLEQNYRSTENILNAANYIIANNRERIRKELYSLKGKGEPICCLEAFNESDEASVIIKKICELSVNGHSYGDCAILYRTNAQSRALEEALIKNGIPYSMIGGVKFYERKEIKDLISYLKLIYNSSDSQSLKRIINVPKRSIGPTSIKKIEGISLQNSLSMFSVCEEIDSHNEFSPKTTAAVNEFVRLIQKQNENLTRMYLSEFISNLIEESGYVNELAEEGTDEAKSRIENIREFISVARDFENSESREDISGDLGDFLTQLSLVSDIDNLDEESQSVTLMTLHSAKGLEFPVVFLAGLEEGIFPHARALNSSFEMEEERRLMYVGVTRAKELLFLSYAKKRLIYGDYKYYTPSRFLGEIPQSLLSSAKSSLQKENEKEKESRYSNRTTGFGRSLTSKPFNSKEKDFSVSFGKDFKVPKSCGSLSKPSSTIKEAAVSVKQVGFEKGDRVFHETFGVGTIYKILEIDSDLVYTVDFGKIGKRALDSGLANLKKF